MIVAKILELRQNYCKGLVRDDAGQFIIASESSCFIDLHLRSACRVTQTMKIMMIFLNRKQMKFTRRQTRDILSFRKVLKRASWPKMKWEEYVSFYYYWKCYRYEYGGEKISLACYDNWKNRVSIRISDNNPYKSRYKELFR